MNDHIPISGRDNVISMANIIVFFILVAVIFGCIYKVYFDDVKQYISKSLYGVSEGSEYLISLINDNVVKYTKMYIPEKISDPNYPIQDDMMLVSSEHNYGTALPWDSAVKPCQILKDTDQDLYANVQGIKQITIY